MKDVPDLTLLDAFNVAGRAWLRIDEVFDRLPQYAHADIIRAIDRLMHDSQLLVRRTIGGTDQVILTERGAYLIGLAARIPE
jgi:hypothetical protein